jgi:prepilin-type N-terminal cleavage/methylation domain-containing protein
MPSDFHALSPSRPSGIRSARGLTLVEVMVAATVFALIMLGIFKIFIESYRYSDLARHRDNVRSILNIYANRFLTEAIPTPPPDNMWSITDDLGTGLGLDVPRFSGPPVTPNASGVLIADIGDLDGVAANNATGSYVRVSFTRVVKNLDESDGTVNLSTVNNAGYGKILQGTFTANFDYKGKSVTQTLTVIRCTK